MHDALPVALILLGSAVAVVVLFRRLSMPAILGYLLVGVAIGPGMLGLVAASEDKRYLAEFGVVFLMFSVGLEFSLPQLMAMRRTVFGFGGAQVALTMAIAALVARCGRGIVEDGAHRGRRARDVVDGDRLEDAFGAGAAAHAGRPPDHGRAPVPGPRGDPAAGADPGAGAARRTRWPARSAWRS